MTMKVTDMHEEWIRDKSNELRAWMADMKSLQPFIGNDPVFEAAFFAAFERAKHTATRYVLVMREHKIDPRCSAQLKADYDEAVKKTP
jgi:hypothetical protein